MAILTVYTKLLDKTLEGARIIDMGSTKSCECNSMYLIWINHGKGQEKNGLDNI
ncbi:MAG: hypothetical protein IJQ59_03345 [Bacteroidaceae bacterium]|nr:hypothetical protein [Bacteroidaceae bacterium]